MNRLAKRLSCGRDAAGSNVGLAPEDLREQMRALARACDLLEAHLTGEDLE